MHKMSSSAWQRRGSSIVFHRDLLVPLIESGAMVSLREALSWANNWPLEPPNGSNTVLIVGLETCLEVMVPSEAEIFLRRTIRPFLLESRNHWDRCGLIFGFGCSEKRFCIDPQESILFVYLDGTTHIRLSEGLWNGAARNELFYLTTPEQTKNHDVVGGYHVRLS
ncbi:hypothetical protein BCD64_00875 [Nostoc sp. MBR 210]|nr:hypothetical protein BCD64_00875 [Nostoc sp. MBR 210]